MMANFLTAVEELLYGTFKRIETPLKASLIKVYDNELHLVG